MHVCVCVCVCVCIAVLGGRLRPQSAMPCAAVCGNRGVLRAAARICKPFVYIQLAIDLGACQQPPQASFSVPYVLRAAPPGGPGPH